MHHIAGSGHRAADSVNFLNSRDLIAMKSLLLVALLALAVAEEAAPQYGIRTEAAPAFTAPDDLVESTEGIEGG